jgi:HEAT repeat protein
MLEELVRLDADVDGELLDAMVKREVFTEEEFPEALQQKLKQQQAVQDFLGLIEDYLRALGRFPAGKYGGRLAAITRFVFPELLRRGHYEEAARVLEAVRSGDHDSEATEVVRGLIDLFGQSLGAADNVARLLEALRDETIEKEEREVLVQLLTTSGAAAAEGLQQVYADSASLSIRTSAFAAMKAIGTPALVPFLAGLLDIEHEWSAVHHVLAALDGLRDPALAEAIKPFVTHENAHVRQAALQRMFELLGPSSEDYLIAALADDDAATRQRAVAYLGSLQSQDPKVLAFFTAALLPEDLTQAEREHDDVLVEICRSLRGMADASFPTGPVAEGMLYDALRQEAKGKRISGMFHKRPAYHSERVRVAICESLGTVGTATTAEALRELGAGETGDVADAVEAAVQKIESRGS